MRQRDSLYLRHILDAISRIEEYTQGITYEEFRASHLHQDAVIRQIEVIGEAAKKVSAELRAEHPEIPWRDILPNLDCCPLPRGERHLTCSICML